MPLLLGESLSLAYLICRRRICSNEVDTMIQRPYVLFKLAELFGTLPNKTKRDSSNTILNALDALKPVVWSGASSRRVQLQVRLLTKKTAYKGGDPNTFHLGDRIRSVSTHGSAVRVAADPLCRSALHFYQSQQHMGAEGGCSVYL